MNKGKRMFGRVIAFALALVMVCSSLGTSAITAYAAGNGETVVTVSDNTIDTTQENVSENVVITPETSSEEGTTEEGITEEASQEVLETDILEEVSVEEVVSDALANVSLYNTEELSYTGSVEDDYWGKKLVINEGDMEAAGVTVSANNIVSIIQAQREETFSVVEINMNSITGVIATQVWNAVANALDSSLNDEGRTELRYNQSGGEAADENWCFGNPAVTEELITFGVTYGAAEGISVQFDSSSIPTEDVSLNLYTDENKTDYESVIIALGDGTMGRVYDAEGTLVENVWVNVEKDTFDDNGTTKNYVNILLGNVKDFTSGSEYLIKMENYSGRIEEDWCGDRLSIDQWAMEEAGITVSDDAIIDIINAQEQKFGIVELNVNAGTDAISVDLWNAAVGILQADDEGNCEIRFNQSGGEYADENWNFNRPYALDIPASAINLDVQRFVGSEGEGITLSFLNNEFPADEVYLNLYTDANRADYEGIIAAFGTYTSAHLYNAGEAVAEIGVGVDAGSFTDDEGNEISSLNISIGDMRNIDINTEYVAKTTIYMGHVEEDWLGNVLVLDIGRMQEDGISVSNNTIAGILGNKEAEYGAVQINYPNIKESISKDIWNAAVALLNTESNEEGYVEIRLNCCGADNNAADENWRFSRPQKTEEDINIGLDWSYGEAEEGLFITFACVEYPAENVNVSLCTDTTRADYPGLGQAIGSESQMVLLDSAGARWQADVGFDADDSEGWYNVWIGNIVELWNDETYTLKTVPYMGNVENYDGHSVLRIAYGESGKEEAFTSDEIKDILAEYASISVNEIYIEQPYDGETVTNNTIDGSVINAALPLLKRIEGAEDPVLSFAFADDYANRTFRIFNPSGEAAETTVSVDANIYVIGEDASTDAIVYKNGQIAFEGLSIEREDLEIVLSRESDNAKACMDLFGEVNCQLALEDTDLLAEYRVEENEIIAYITGSERLEDEKEYKLTIAEYTGIVEDNVLFIYPWHAEPYGVDYTEELIISVLEDYDKANEKFARVEVGVFDHEADPYAADISAEIYNAAAKLIDPDADYPADDLGRGFKYVFYNDERCIAWNFVNPTELDKDIQMKHWIGFDEKTGNVIMTTNIPDLSGTRVNFEFVPNDFEERDITDDLKERLGDGYEEIGYILSPIPTREVVYFDYHAYRMNDGRVEIIINGIDALKNDTVYEVVRTDFGNAWTDIWDDGTEYHNLYISSRDVGKETFDNGDIEKYLAWRTMMGETFDCIYIEQGVSHDENDDLDNSIRKADYNYIRTKLLNTENERASIVYIYDASYKDENGVWIQDQIRYEFLNPSEMSKDMDASVNFAWVENYDNNGEIIHGGIDVYMPKTTVPASGVNVQIQADYDSKTGEWLRYTLGDHGDDGTMCKIITDKKTLTALNNDVWLSGYYSDGRQIHHFQISDAQLLPQNAYSRIYPIQGRGEDVLYVARKEELNTSVEGTNTLWKSFTPNTATVAKDADGKYYIDPVMEGMALYGSYCLIDGATPIVEIFGGYVEKKVVSMKFTNASVANPIEMELPPSGEESWEALNYLDLRFYPTGTGLDNQDLEWFVGTVEDPTVSANCVELLADADGYHYGEFKALEAGEAIITVTAKDDPALKAAAKVIVKPAVVDEIDWESIMLLAIDGYDKTLADIADELPKGFAWVDGKTGISDYKDMFVFGFPAIYTSPIDGRTAEVNVPVMILSIESELQATVNDEFALEDGDVLENGRTADLEMFSYVVNSRNEDAFNVEELNTILDEYGREDIRFEISTSSKPKNLLAEKEDKSGVYEFTADSSAKGKKTFTMTLNIVNTETNKSKVFKKDSVSIIVPAKPLFDWAEYIHFEGQAYNGRFHKIPKGSEYPVAHDAMSVVGETGVYVITQPADNYYKITVKSLDSAVCKLGKAKVTDSEDKSEKITTIPYEIKRGGYAFIELIAADEVKSKKGISFEVFDMMPKVVSGAATIDVTMTDIDAQVKWQMMENTELGEVSVSGKDSEYFEVTISEQDTNDNRVNDTAIVGINLKDRTIKTGKYKLDITVPVTLDDRTEDFTTTVTVTVKASKPVYTAKQIGKVNLYYDNNYMFAQGSLTLSDNVESVELADQSETKKCDYRLVEINDNPNLRAISLKDGGNPKNNKGKLILTIDGVYKEVEVNISIKTENKAPKLVLSSASSTVYPNYGQNVFKFMVSDKTSGESALLDALEIQNADGTWTSFTQDTTTIINGKNNSYSITYYDGYFIGYPTTVKKATDKLNIRVKPQGSVSTITLKYSVKVDPAVPTLVPSNKTVTINKNEEFYREQIASTTLSLKGAAVSFAEPEACWVDIEGVDAKAIAAKNANLNLDWRFVVDDNDKPNLEIWTRIDDNDSLKADSYKYKVTVYQEGYEPVSCQITVKVIDVASAKCLKVSAKGSIDVLDRYTSAVKYTPKLKNLQGTLKAEFAGYESYLSGPDGYKFATKVEGNALCIYARDGEIYSTKQTYYVTPVFVYENEDGQTFEIKGKQQKIKVKQGKPKVTLTSSEGNTLYRDRNNELTISVDALLNKKIPVNVEHIELANYTEDLICDYDNETGTITLHQYDVNQIIASGKTWKVKFNVYYAERAVNEKPVQVTYKLVVK